MISVIDKIIAGFTR